MPSNYIMNVFSSTFTHAPKLLTFVFIIFSTILSNACATQLVEKNKLNEYAVLTAGSTNAWRFIINPTLQTIKIISVDQQPVEHQYGPIYLKPGTHIVTTGIEGDYTHEKITVAAGDKLELTFMPSKTLKDVGRIAKIKKTTYISD